MYTRHSRLCLDEVGQLAVVNKLRESIVVLLLLFNSRLNHPTERTVPRNQKQQDELGPHSSVLAEKQKQSIRCGKEKSSNRCSASFRMLESNNEIVEKNRVRS